MKKVLEECTKRMKRIIFTATVEKEPEKYEYLPSIHKTEPGWRIFWELETVLAVIDNMKSDLS